LRLKDFEIIELLGSGSFGKVLLARKKSKLGKSSREEKLALKFVPRQRVLEVEKRVFIEAIGHPFLVQLVSSFHTEVTCCFKHSMIVHLGVSVCS